MHPEFLTHQLTRMVLTPLRRRLDNLRYLSVMPQRPDGIDPGRPRCRIQRGQN